jgi:hypothetical protein
MDQPERVGKGAIRIAHLRNPAIIVAGLVPAIHVLLGVKQKDGAVRYDAGHDEGKRR